MGILHDLGKHGLARLKELAPSGKQLGVVRELRQRTFGRHLDKVGAPVDLVTLMIPLVKEAVLRILELEARNAELGELADRCEKTGAYRLRAFRSRAEERITPFERALYKRDVKGENVTPREIEDVRIHILFLDIDKFKHLNDAIGHIAADEVLRQMVVLINSKLRGEDFIGRHGGEEFVVLTEDGDPRVLAERIRKAVKDHTFRVRVNGHGEQDIKITLSIGIATCREVGENKILDAEARSGQAMQLAKDAGRDRIWESRGDGEFLPVDVSRAEGGAQGDEVPSS